jgi:hypothetical protein
MQAHNARDRSPLSPVHLGSRLVGVCLTWMLGACNCGSDPGHCNSDAECATGAHCQSHICVGNSSDAGSTDAGTPDAGPRSAACDAGSDCDGGFCVSGFCCATACNGVCQSCGLDGQCNQTPADDARCGTITCSTLSTQCRTFSDLITNRCQSFGVCKTVSTADCTSVVNAGTTTVCGGTAPCNAFCDGQGNCGAFPGAATHCGTQSATCNTGSCNGAGACALPGTSVSCAGAAPCDAKCDGAGNCGNFPGNTTACGASTNVCNTGVCNSAGACAVPVSGTACAGTAPCNAVCDGVGNCGAFPGGTTPCGAQTATCNIGACNGAGACGFPGTNVGCGTQPKCGGKCTGAQMCSGAGGNCFEHCDGAGSCLPCSLPGCCNNGDC